MSLEAVMGALAQLLMRPRRARDPDDGNVDLFVANEAGERRKNLFIGEVAGRAEKDERAGLFGAHVPSSGFSWWPPNSNRIADISLSAYSAAPRDSKRPNRAALRTGAGTPSSIAACNVQRPSPESDTLPAKPLSDGSCRSAAAVRSRSQEPITLPRRQSSAMRGRSRS